MKNKVSELIGKELDYAVAICRGFEGIDEDQWLMRDGIADMPLHAYTPSSDWSQAGPIIESNNITIIRCNDEYLTDSKGYCTNKRIPNWFAETSKYIGHNINESYEGEYMEPSFIIEADGFYGSTALIAAMRSFVALKLGDEIEIPTL